MQLDLRAETGFLWVFLGTFLEVSVWLIPDQLCFTFEPLADGLEFLVNTEINFVKTRDKPEALLAVRLKTQIHR